MDVWCLLQCEKRARNRMFQWFFCGSGVGGSGSWYLKAWFPSHRKPSFSGASYCWTNNLESNLELEIYSSFWWQSRGGVGWNSTAGPTLTIAILKMVLSQFSVAPGTWRTKDHVGTSVTSTDLLEQLYLEFFSLEQMDFFPKHGGSTLPRNLHMSRNSQARGCKSMTSLEQPSD